MTYNSDTLASNIEAPDSQSLSIQSNCSQSRTQDTENLNGSDTLSPNPKNSLSSPKIPLSLIGELFQLVSPPENEEFGLLNFCDLDWTREDLDWMDYRGDMERLPRFLELAEQVNRVLVVISPENVITDSDDYGSYNNHRLAPFGAFLKLDEHGLIEDDTPGEAATALEVLNFVFEFLNAVGGLTAPMYVWSKAILLKRWDICKALGVGSKSKSVLVKKF